MAKKYYIYYHGDLDGMAAAYLLRRFLLRKGFEVEYGAALEYSPTIQEAWVTYPFKEPFILVDFQNHPRAAGFIDHHESNRPTTDLSHLDFYYFDSSLSSAAAAVAALAKREGVALGRVTRLIRQASIVDSGDFRRSGIKPLDVVCPQDAFLKVFAIIDHDYNYAEMAVHRLTNPGFFGIIYGEMFDRRLEKLVADPFFIRKFRVIERETQTVLASFPLVSHEEGELVIYDDSDLPFNRFVPAVFYPQSLLWSGISKHKNGFSVKANLNPWAAPEKVHELFVERGLHLGQIMKRHGGGGHARVGATTVTSRAEAEKVLESVLSELRPFLK